MWPRVTCLYVCLWDDNFRKPWLMKFIFTHPVYLHGILVKFAYECHQVRVLIRGWSGIMFAVIHLAVRSFVVYYPSVNTYFTWCHISSLSGDISIKLGTNICHVSGRCWKVFQDQRSKVKVICVWRRCAFQQFDVDAHLFIRLSWADLYGWLNTSFVINQPEFLYHLFPVSFVYLVNPVIL